MKSVKVKIDNTIYDSIQQAAESINCNAAYLSTMLSHGRTKYKQYNIGKVNVNCKNSSDKRARGCPVTCITTNEKFDSIQAVANKLNLNAWTIGLKMDKAGKFIDKNGNEYIRELPMKSRKSNVVYPEQKPFMLHSNIIKTPRVVTSINKPVNVRENTISTLKTISSDLLKNGMYKEASYICEALVQLTK